MAKTSRHCAVEALLQIHQQGAYSNVLLGNLAARGALSPQELGLASTLVYGVLERQLTLDAIINHYSKRPVEKLDPAVAEILRISLYQLLYLDHIPDAAAVNEGVKLTRSLRVTSAGGFVNGILRSFLREGKALPQPKGDDLPSRWELDYSCPAALSRRLLQSASEGEVQSLLEHSLGRPPLYARVNSCKTDVDSLCKQLAQEGVEAQPWRPEGCIRLGTLSSLEGLPSFRQGLFHIQDASSQLCARLCGARTGQRVLDLCAAPGSKSFSMALDMGDQGEILSCDIYPEKLKKIREGAERLGLRSIKVLENDARNYRPELGLFDRVLCDVPCSGLGIIARKPEIKYKNLEDFAQLLPLQQEILDTAARYVKPGGQLTYSTCTLLPEENQQQVEGFLARHGDFEPLPLPEHKSGWYSVLFPQDQESDGFFLATMRKVR